MEKAIYYLSKKMLDYETRYTPLEKACLALVWATRKLRHYLLAHSVILVSRLDPIKYLFEKPGLMGKLARWLLLLSEFDLKYMTVTGPRWGRRYGSDLRFLWSRFLL